jgi:geranylgeranyl pyrophosphate synthase
VLAAVRATDALAYTRAAAERHIEVARTALAPLPASPERRALESLAAIAVDRRS